MCTKIKTKIHVGAMKGWDGGCQNTKVDWRPIFFLLLFIINDILKCVCKIWKIASCISCLKWKKVEIKSFIGNVKYYDTSCQNGKTTWRSYFGASVVSDICNFVG